MWIAFPNGLLYNEIHVENYGNFFEIKKESCIISHSECVIIIKKL
jgi:hypothetical protein